MSSSYRLQLAPDEGLEACKFRERIPALESSSRAPPVLVERETGRHERYVVAAGGKRYEGSREAVGTSATNASCYVAVSVSGDGTMTLTPLSEWYAFRPEATHQTIDIDDAEMLMERSDKKSKLADMKLERLLKKKDDFDEEEEGGKKKGKDGGGSGGGDGGGGKARREGGAEGMDDDDDEFDDGAGSRWAARADDEEDGNDGLDMADENPFEDDEDDTFAATKEREMQFGCVSTDREESEAFQAAEDSRAQYEERRIKQLADLAQEQEEHGIERTGDDEEEFERAHGDTEWGRRTKEDLKAERAQRRRDEDSEEDDDDDVDHEEEDIKDFLRQSAAAEGSAAATEGAAAAAAGKAAVAGGKRPLSPGRGAAADGAATDGAKRVKQEREQQLERTAAAAAAASGAASVRVEERDVVLIIHRRGKMTLKELVTEFKAYVSQSKDHKKEFMGLIKAIAYMTEVDGIKYAKLNEATLVKYDLEQQ